MPGQIHHHSLLKIRNVAPTTDLTTGLLHYWKFEGNANDSVGGAHGTLFNSPTLVTGLLGQAYSYNGTNQYITVPDAVSAPPTISVIYWVKSNTPTWANFGIVASSRVANGFVSYGSANSKAKSYRLFNNTGGFSEINPSGPAASIELWHMYGFMYDHAAQMFYPIEDGVVKTEFTASRSIPRTSDTIPLTFIRDPATNNHGNLVLDNFAIWNRVLTASELTYYYNSGAGRVIL